MIFYSPSSAQHIAEGEDYFSTRFSDEDDVRQHLETGSIIGVALGAAGDYFIRFHDGYPTDSEIDQFEFAYRVAVRVADGCLVFRDIYDLVYWSPSFEESACVQIRNGIYHVTMLSSCPPSGVFGDQQQIEMFFQPLSGFPALTKTGLPYLCPS